LRKPDGPNPDRDGGERPRLDHELATARALLRAAARIVVLTGAGVSAESGVPTFRGAQGLWRSFRPEELATPEAFAREPRLVWEWYTWRRDLVAGCAPNAAHRALAALAADHPDVRLVTQNVDGLHERAAEELIRERARQGSPVPPAALEALHPVELHGSILRARCVDCGERSVDAGSAPHPGMAATPGTLPICSCGGLLRPDVVWFGEMLDATDLAAASDAAARADLCLVVGTSAVVYPAAGLARLTHEAGGAVIEVNPEATPLSAIAAVTLRGAAAELVPALVG
jgi:NAD-dependent deacetylase